MSHRMNPGMGQDGTTEPQEPRVLAEVFVTRRIAQIMAGGSENVRVAAFRAIAQEEVDGEFYFQDEDGFTTTVTVFTHPLPGSPLPGF